MNYKQVIENELNNSGGKITWSFCKENNIPTNYLTRLVDEGKIIRVYQGVYIDSSGDYDEYYFFSKKSKRVVFSYSSALYLHRLTDIIPEKMEITVYTGYNTHRITKDIGIHYVKKNIYPIGITTVNTIFGNPVQVYDIERTICDIIVNRKKFDSEMFSKSIQRYAKYKERNLKKLYEYSKKMDIYEKVNDIMEIVL